MTDKVYLNAFTTHSSIIGCIIKIIRINKKIKQRKFADLIGLSVSSISKVERGEYNFGFDFVISSCDVLGISLKQLFSAYDTIISFMKAQGIVVYNMSMPDAISHNQTQKNEQSETLFSMPMSGKLIQQYIVNSKTMNEAILSNISNIPGA
jgi:transcriptional regulator with XRE-family HTH domain